MLTIDKVRLRKYYILVSKKSENGLKERI